MFIFKCSSISSKCSSESCNVLHLLTGLQTDCSSIEISCINLRIAPITKFPQTLHFCILKNRGYNNLVKRLPRFGLSIFDVFDTIKTPEFQCFSTRQIILLQKSAQKMWGRPKPAPFVLLCFLALCISQSILRGVPQTPCRVLPRHVPSRAQCRE